VACGGAMRAGASGSLGESGARFGLRSVLLGVQTVFEEADELFTRVDAEFRVDVLRMSAYGVFRDEQLVGDERFAAPVGDEQGYVDFAGGEPALGAQPVANLLVGVGLRLLGLRGGRVICSCACSPPAILDALLGASPGASLSVP
ncbi:MAG: hypothetical protein V8T51_06035, partial [Senegalimassilia faecalis]